VKTRGFTLIQLLIVVAILVAIAGVTIAAIQHHNQSGQHGPVNDHPSTATPSTTSSSSPTASSTPAVSAAVQAGQQLSNNECSGTGTVPLVSAPVAPKDISIIEPYGLTVGGHVTPIDHEYYWAKNNVKDSSDVHALADGRLVDIEYRDHNGQGPIPGDYRVIISYTCTFMSYFDLATSLAPDIASQLPAGWEKTGHTPINIPVKAGQVVAKMGGQSLDFAVWNMEYNNPKLLVPSAYAAEPWKIHTVAPLDYFSADVKTSLLPFYVRQVEPRDGTYAYDTAGSAIGTWFKQGTGGYHDQQGVSNYWAGHLAIAPDFIDPTVWGISLGDYQGQATQFTLKPPVTDPGTVTTAAGVVKYQLLHPQRYLQTNGKEWDGLATPTSALHLPTTGAAEATALVQLTDANTLKFEVFVGKTPSQVSDFDSSALTYTRDGK
jgi:hypothetical protein